MDRNAIFRIGGPLSPGTLSPTATGLGAAPIGLVTDRAAVWAERVALDRTTVAAGEVTGGWPALDATLAVEVAASAPSIGSSTDPVFATPALA
jgi:hypothetical protein